MARLKPSGRRQATYRKDSDFESVASTGSSTNLDSSGTNRTPSPQAQTMAASPEGWKADEKEAGAACRIS